MSTVRSLPQNLRMAEAAAYLARHRLLLVPVIPCPECGISLPADHTCPINPLPAKGDRHA